MSRMVKRVTKKLTDRLGPNEAVRAAMLVEAAGTYGLGGIGIALSPSSGQAALERKARDHAESHLGRAREFPTGSAMVIVTDTRVLVVPSNGLTFKETALELDSRELLVGDIRPRGLARRVQLVFRDGSHVEVDVQRGQSPEAFAAVVGRAGIQTEVGATRPVEGPHFDPIVPRPHSC